MFNWHLHKQALKTLNNFVDEKKNTCLLLEVADEGTPQITSTKTRRNNNNNNNNNSNVSLQPFEETSNNLGATSLLVRFQHFYSPGEFNATFWVEQFMFRFHNRVSVQVPPLGLFSRFQFKLGFPSSDLCRNVPNVFWKIVATSSLWRRLPTSETQSIRGKGDDL